MSKAFLPDQNIIDAVSERIKDPDCSYEEKVELLNLLDERDYAVKTNKLAHFKPYPYQLQFYEASAKSRFSLLSAATRIGKTMSISYLFAALCTGLYPSWWKGKRFKTPISAWAIGITTDSTNKVMAYECLGIKGGKSLNAKEFDGEGKGILGSGSFPLHTIVENSIVKDGDQIISFKCRWYDENGEFGGYSDIEFKSSAQGESVLFGHAKHLIWFDEEPPHNSRSLIEQAVVRTTTTKGLVIVSATAEFGYTDMIKTFRENEDPDYYFQKAGVYDAHVSLGGHITDRDIEILKATCPPHRLPMRLYGEPSYGSGVVFDLDLNSITCAPFTPPLDWKRVCSLDIGNAHRTVITFACINPADNCVYLYFEFCDSGKTPSHYASIIKKADPTIPVILPEDAWQDKGAGITYYQAYKDEGLNVKPIPFYNTITVDGVKDKRVEYGIEEMRVRMLEGRLKIFSTCGEVLKEMAMYHRDERGKIVKKHDDAIDSARYSILSAIANRGEPKTNPYDDYKAPSWQYRR